MNEEQNKMWNKLKEPYSPHTKWLDEYEASFQKMYRALYSSANKTASAFDKLGEAMKKINTQKEK